MPIRKKGDVEIKTSAKGAQVKQTGYTFYSYDKNSAALYFNFREENGEPTDLANATIRLVFVLNDEKITPKTDDIEIWLAVPGTARYIIPESMLGHEGKVTGYVYLEFSDGSHTDEGRFTFEIKQSMITDMLPEAGEQYVKDFEDIKAEVQEAADGAKETISQKVTEVSDTSNSAISKVNQVADDTIKTADQAQGDIQTSVSDVQSRQVGAEKDIAGLVESTESARDEAIKTMNELDYSDINLLTGTSQNWKEETIDYWSVLPHDVPLERMGIKIGDTVTYSVEIDNTVDDINNTIDIKMFAYNSTRYKEIKGSSKSNEIKPGEIGVASTSLTIPEETDRLRLYIRREDSNGSKKIKYHKSKLQRGNLSTPWTPAPEDIGLKSELEQIKQAIINLGGSV